MTVGDELVSILKVGTVLAGGGIGAAIGSLIGLICGTAGAGALVGLGAGLVIGGVFVIGWW